MKPAAFFMLILVAAAPVVARAQDHKPNVGAKRPMARRIRAPRMLSRYTKCAASPETSSTADDKINPMPRQVRPETLLECQVQVEALLDEAEAADSAQ